MITFLYRMRDDGTYVILHNDNPYHVIPEDPMWEQCVEEYDALDEEPPDEPLPPAVEVREDPMAALLKRIEALETKLCQ